MKKIIILLLTTMIPLLMLAGIQGKNNPVTADLTHEMANADATEHLRINIRLVQQYDAQAFNSIRQSMTRQQRRSYVVNELKSFAAQTQQSVLTELETLQIAGEVNQVNPLWIANVINCYATPSAIEQLAQHADIARIDIDEERILIDPVEFTDATEDQLREITYNVTIMNVPQVWDLGFTGQDVVVAVLDTGVNYNHNDLVNNMWEHPDYPFHGWNFTNNSNNPMDFHGHGTHCAGTVAGDGTAGSQTGMAPSAKIMALQVLTASGGGTESGVWAAIEFGVEFGADVLSLSLGWQHSWGPDRATWRATMDNALAAGVIASVAAGNEGTEQGLYPIPDNVRTPGDVPAPWRHLDQPNTGTRSAVVCVGATNQSDNIANFSSRGPVTWQNVSPYNDYQYNPGQGLIRPDVVAPGVDVKSLRHNNNTGYIFNSGTSMATPGVAGVMALMLSKDPNLSPEQISQILEETALPLSANKSNTFGSGRVDALAAICAIGTHCPSNYTSVNTFNSNMIEAYSSVSSCADGYKLRYKPTVFSAPLFSSLPFQESNLFRIPGLLGGTSFDIEIQKKCLNGTWSQWIPRGVPTTTSHESTSYAPTGLTVRVNSTVGITWLSNSKVNWSNGYFVEYKKKSDVSWTSSPGTSSTNWTLYGLPTGIEYQVRIKVPRSGGTDYTEPVTFKMGTVQDCGGVTNLSITNITGTSALVTWTNASSPYGTYVAYKPNNGYWTLLGATTNSKTISGLTPNTLYHVAIKNYCPSGFSGWQNTSFSTTNGGIVRPPIHDKSGIYSELFDNIEILGDEMEFSVFPNPTKGIFTCEVTTNSGGRYSIRVLNMFGVEIKSKTLYFKEGLNAVNIDLNDFPAGTYTIVISNFNKNYFSKIIKN